MRILDELVAAGARCFALSNFGRDTFALARPHLTFLDRFEAVLTSGEVRMAKPDPAVFRLLCDRRGFAPTNAVFVDDSGANVAGAAELGFDAIRFTSAGQLRSALAARGLLG